MPPITHTLKNGAKLILIFDKSIDLKQYKSFVYSLEQMLVRILNTEELTFHLRDIKIKFESEEVSESERRFLMKSAKPELPARVEDGQIEFGFYHLREIRMAKGISWFYNGLYRVISHELVHYVHNEINSSIRNVIKIQTRLSKIRKVSSKQLNQLDTEMFLNLVDTYLYRIVQEGCAMLFEKLKHDKLVFIQSSFNELYKDAMKSTKLFIEIFDKSKSIRSIDELHSFAKKYLMKVFDTHEYTIGLHVIYSILYLREGTLDVNMKEIANEFVSFFGRLKPKRLFLEYEVLMKKHGLQPVIGFTSSAYLNCKDIQQQWKVTLAHLKI